MVQSHKILFVAIERLYCWDSISTISCDIVFLPHIFCHCWTDLGVVVALLAVLAVGCVVVIVPDLTLYPGHDRCLDRIGARAHIEVLPNVRISIRGATCRILMFIDTTIRQGLGSFCQQLVPVLQKVPEISLTDKTT